MNRRLSRWLLRALAVLALTAIIALVILVKPLPEPTASPLAPAFSPVQAPTLTATSPPPTPAPSATLTPVEPTATSTPVATEQPTDTPAAGSIQEPTGTLSGTTILQAPIMFPDFQHAGRVERRTYSSQVAGGEESYHIYLPPGYDQTDRRYPLLILLHGWPYDASHWDNLGVDEVADREIQAGTLPPFIILLPGADPDGVFVTTSGGDLSFEGQLLHDLLPQVEAAYRVSTDPRERALGGISRGGVWALEIGFRHPDLFAAVGGHSPALKYNLASAAYDPFTMIDNPGVAALRIYLDAGDTDWALQHTEALHAALDARGIANQFAVHAGSHSDGMWAANLAEYLAFYAAGW